MKIVIIGNSSTGKSSILKRYHTHQFSENFLPTIGIDFIIKVININGKTIKLHLFDTAG